VKHGEQGDKFYVILKGVMTVQVPNQSIKNWKLKFTEFKEQQDKLVSVLSKYYDFAHRKHFEKSVRKHEQNRMVWLGEFRDQED
jgi:hypothetical protein